MNYPFTQELAILIKSCCHGTYNARNVEKLFSLKETILLIRQIATNKFPVSHPLYEKSTIKTPNDLYKEGLGHICYKLMSREGFDQKWSTFDDNHLEAHVRLWIQHRLDGLLKLGSKSNTSTIGSLNTENQDESELLGSFESDSSSHLGTETLIIQTEVDAEIEYFTEFVQMIPIIATVIASQSMDEKITWNLFKGLNDDNLAKWFMAHPHYCQELDVIDYFLQKSKFNPTVNVHWNSNHSDLLSELNTAETLRGRIAKEYTVLALHDQWQSINDVRSVSSKKETDKACETLRRRNNTTQEAIHQLCLLSLLTLKGTSMKGQALLKRLTLHHFEHANLPTDQDASLNTSMLVDWVHSPHSFNALQGPFCSILAQLRYNVQHSKLSANQEEKIKQSVNLLKKIGEAILANYDVPLQRR